jgi:hypothetical protein
MKFHNLIQMLPKRIHRNTILPLHPLMNEIALMKFFAFRRQRKRRHAVLQNCSRLARSDVTYGAFIAVRQMIYTAILNGIKAVYISKH